MRAVLPTHLFNTPFTRQGFLRRLRLVLGLLGLRPLALRRRVPLVPLILLGSGLRPHLLLVSLAMGGRGPRVRLPFPHPLEAPATPVVRGEGPESRQPVRLSLPLKVEVLPGSALGAGAGNRSRVLVRARSSGGMTSPSGTLFRTSVSFPTSRAAHLGLWPCDKGSRRCLPKEP